MLKYLLLTATVLLGAYVAPLDPACASELYVSAHVGATTQVNVDGIRLDDGNTFGAAIGAEVLGTRVEAGIDRHNASFGGGVLQGSATVYNASVFLDLHPFGADSAVYVGGGGDWAQASGHIYNSSISDDGYGYHVAAGASTRINDHLILDAQARYTHLDVFDGTSDVTYTVGGRWAL